MDIEIFSICNEAYEKGERLYIMGVFSHIISPAYPYIHKTGKVAIRLRFPNYEAGVYPLKIRLIDTHGGEVMEPISEIIQVPWLSGNNQYIINLVQSLNDLRFAAPGQYTFQLYMDEDWKASVMLYLEYLAPAPTPGKEMAGETDLV